MVSNECSAEPWMGALQFYKEQIVNIAEARNDKDEDDFEKIKQLQEQRYKEFDLYAWIFFLVLFQSIF